MALTSNQLKNTRVLGEKFNKAYCREKLNELSKKSFEAQSPTTLRAYLHEASDTVLGNCDDSSSWSKWKEWKDSSMATNDVATHAASEDGRAVPEVEATGKYYFFWSNVSEIWFKYQSNYFAHILLIFGSNFAHIWLNYFIDIWLIFECNFAHIWLNYFVHIWLIFECNFAHIWFIVAVVEEQYSSLQ